MSHADYWGKKGGVFGHPDIKVQPAQPSTKPESSKTSPQPNNAPSLWAENQSERAASVEAPVQGADKPAAPSAQV